MTTTVVADFDSVNGFSKMYHFFITSLFFFWFFDYIFRNANAALTSEFVDVTFPADYNSASSINCTGITYTANST